MRLVPHARSRPSPVRVHADVTREGPVLRASFAITGATDRIIWPPPAPPVRTDGLWQASCLELFAHAGTPAYAEANWSPSGAWASYAFADYRAGMADGPAAPPPHWDATLSMLTACIDLSGVLDPAADWWAGLCAVIVTDDGRVRHFALAHPPGAADFHHRDCFPCHLPPAHPPC